MSTLLWSDVQSSDGGSVWSSVLVSVLVGSLVLSYSWGVSDTESIPLTGTWWRLSQVE